VSLLLDALRRAAASKQGPEADQYVAPRRDDTTLEPDPEVVPRAGDETAESYAGRGGEARTDGRQGVERARTGAEQGEVGDDDLELSLEPETGDAAGEDERPAGRAPAAPDREGTPAAMSRARSSSGPMANTLLKARGGGGGPRRGHGILAGLGLVVVIAVALTGGGWWYYVDSREAAERGLAAYEPTAEPLVELSENELRDDTTAGEDAGGGPDGGAADQGGGATASGTNGGDETLGAAAEPPSDEGSTAASDGQQDGTSMPRDESASASASAAGEATTGETEPAPAAEPEKPADDATQTASAARVEPEPEPKTETKPKPESETRKAQPLVKTSGPSMLERALEAGYNALRAGDLATADREYSRALRRDDDNRDALLGLASVAERRGETERAARYYQRILADQPRDPHARAGLASLAARLDPRRSETELKRLLRDYPDSPLLNFALGNVYAGESRWGEAQQRYFRAYRAEPENPEYAYNLAVALDHLQQRRAALEHYRAALARLDGTATGFSAAAVRRRIEQLE